MSTKIEKRIMVNVPVSVAYNQWTQFEEFPHFMSGIKKVTQLSDSRLQWVAEIGGVKREWEAKILEQTPDRKVSWAATEGATNAGAVMFEDLGGGQTSIRLELEYEPEGMVEKFGDKLNVVEKQAESDLERFKAFIEDEGYASGAWRGSVGDGTTTGSPSVADAASSRGDGGKAGISGKVAAVGLGAAAAAAAGIVAASKGNDQSGARTGSDVHTGTDAVPPVVTPVVDTPTVVVPPVDAGVPGERPLGEPFDQTNGLIDTDGDSDGLAESDTRSAAERDEDPDAGAGGILPPRTPGT